MNDKKGPMHRSFFVNAVFCRKGKPVEWKHVHQMLLAFNLGPDDFPYRLAKGLHENDGNLHKVVPELLTLLKQQKLDVHPEYLPGLTPKELEPYQSKKTR